MARTRKKKFKKPSGLQQGIPQPSPELQDRKVKISIIDYDVNQFIEKEVKSVDECIPFKESPSITWIKIDGVHDPHTIAEIAKRFNMHPLIVEDIMTTDIRPKMDDVGDYISVVLKTLSYEEKENFIKTNQVSIVFGQNYVISFHEKESDIFNPIRERIRNAKGRIRNMTADYLVYALLDQIVDNYFILLDKIEERIEMIEEGLIHDPKSQTLNEIHQLTNDIILFRKTIWPLREIISRMIRAESDLFNESTTIYFKDIYDHIIQLLDNIKTFRDTLSGVLEIYYTSNTTRMNEVMKVLTVVSTIFIPLTFIASLYGMNFRYMPELESPVGYPVVMGIMAFLGIAMLIFFKVRKWL